MLTKTETRLVDKYLSIHERYVDKAIFYRALLNIVPRWRAEQLHDSDAYEEYIKDLAGDKDDAN